jgi:pSer/pThr/pTyr-binding forkhead associated (FHA) protein
MPKFLLRFEGAVIKEITAEDQITVGRKTDNQVVIDSPAVSGHHCKIIRIGETYFVEDRYSTNGVFLNSKKIVKSELQNNDLIGIANYVLEFIDDHSQLNAPVTPASEAPVVQPPVVEDEVPPPPKPQEAAPAASNSALQKPAVIRVLKGIVNKTEFELKSRSTYIGKSDRVQIRIKGTGLFGSAPESAAMIAYQQTGYFLVPVKAGYVKLNGRVLHQKELLRNGDVIQAGGTTLKFEQNRIQSLESSSQNS